MSIIYDALKKVEESLHKDSAVKIDKKESKPKFRIYLLYTSVVLFGFFIAHIFFNLFTKIPQKTTGIVAQNKSQIKINQEKNLQQELPNKELPVETELPVSSETEKNPPPSLVLNGVFFSENEGYALINNRIVKEGDVIDGAAVVRITLDEVICEFEGSKIKLSTGIK